MKERWRALGVKCCDGDKTCPALAGLSQREDKVGVCPEARWQRGRRTLLSSCCPTKNVGKRTVQERDEVVECCSPTQTHWPLMLFLNEKIREGGQQIQ